ncbi:MAG: ABC transporter ATP-binding protein [Lachnospiraceae bacterium]|jgi:ABC-2 type transport system ATP-binding protein
MDEMIKLEPIIKISGLTKVYGEKRAVDNLYLTVGKGEVFGLLGPNGAGKTTTVLMLLGLTEPTEGFAWIDGHDCIREPIAVKRIVGYLPDNVGFYNDLTGRENLRFTGRLNGLSGDFLEQRIEELLERVGMAEAADKKAGTYSRGMKQRLGIADVLMKDPKVIIMDEPTLGIDPQGMRELLELIRELAEKDKRTIMISSHQLQQIQQVCDRVGIFVKGKLIACGPIETLGQQLEKEGHFVTEIQADPMDGRLIQLLESIETVKAVNREGQSLIIDSTEDIRKEMGRRLVEQGYALLGLKQKGGELDEIYRQYFEQEA